MLANVVVADQILLREDAKNRREAESVGARTHAQMVIRHLGGLGATRIDHDERAVRIGRDVAEDRTCALKAMRLPWILADEYRDLSLLIASAEARPEKHVIDPELAGLFLGQGVGAEYRSKRAPRRRTVTAAQMIALPAAAVIEDARAAVSVAHALEASRDLANSGVPVDFLEGAVWASTQRRGQAVPAVLVVVNPLRLLASVTLRGHVIAISTDARDVAPVELYLDPAVNAAQDANGLLPVVTHGEAS